jgi:hypothetical protein
MEHAMTTTRPLTVGDVAGLVRAKNAGPFWLTLDIFCDTDAAYEMVAGGDAISPESIGARYNASPDDVRIFRIPELRAVKVSLPRPVTQGNVFDRDMHAGQQHVPLLTLPLGAATQLLGFDNLRGSSD